MQRSGTEAIRTQIQPSKPKQEITNITYRHNTKRSYGQLSEQLYLACNDKKAFSLRKTIIEDITFGLVRMYVTLYRFSWAIFILGLALSYTDKSLVFRWVQIVLLL